MPFPEQCFKATVEHSASHLKEKMSTFQRQAHRLALPHSLVDEVAHSRLRGCTGDSDAQVLVLRSVLRMLHRLLNQRDNFFRM